MDEGVIYGVAFPNVEVNLELAQEYAGIVAYLCEERPHSTVLDISGVTYLAKDAREWLRDHSNQAGITVSVALITNSYTSKIIGNIFLRLSRPSFPMRLFSDKEEAMRWARKNYSTHMSAVELYG